MNAQVRIAVVSDPADVLDLWIVAETTLADLDRATVVGVANGGGCGGAGGSCVGQGGAQESRQTAVSAVGADAETTRLAALGVEPVGLRARSILAHEVLTT